MNWEEFKKGYQEMQLRAFKHSIGLDHSIEDCKRGFHEYIRFSDNLGTAGTCGVAVYKCITCEKELKALVGG